MAFGKMMSNAMNTFKNVLVKDTRAVEAVQRSVSSGMIGRATRGARAEVSALAGAGVTDKAAFGFNSRRAMAKADGKGLVGQYRAGLSAMSRDSFKPGYLKRVGIGAGVGAAAGAGKSAMDGDGSAGFAGNIAGGAALGALAGHVHFGSGPGGSRGSMMLNAPKAGKAAGKSFAESWRANYR